MSKKDIDIARILDKCNMDQAEKLTELMGENHIDKETTENIERIFFSKLAGEKSLKVKRQKSYELRKWSAVAACVAIFAIILVLTLPSLLKKGNSTTDPEDEEITDIEYFTMESSYRHFFNAQELVDEADVVFLGKVTGISFQVFDISTALPPTKDTRKDDLFLFTIYDIEVEASYKGEGVTRIRQMGGIKGSYIKEQVKALKDADVWKGGIFIMEDKAETIEVGATYLLAVAQFEKSLPTFFWPAQSYYNMKDPFKEHPKELTAKKIISAFGKDKWEAYWQRWKSADPDWASWKDKDAVEASQDTYPTELRDILLKINEDEYSRFYISYLTWKHAVENDPILSVSSNTNDYLLIDEYKDMEKLILSDDLYTYLVMKLVYDLDRDLLSSVLFNDIIIGKNEAVKEYVSQISDLTPGYGMLHTRVIKEILQNPGKYLKIIE